MVVRQQVLGFGFKKAGILTNNGRNLFFARQNAELVAINNDQIWWFWCGCVGLWESSSQMPAQDEVSRS